MGCVFFHFFPVPLPQVISFTGCVALVPSQDMASGPRPTRTVLCTPSLHTGLLAWTGLQLCSGQWGDSEWQPQTWGHHAGRGSFAFTAPGGVRCITTSTDAQPHSSSPENGSQGSEEEVSFSNLHKLSDGPVAGLCKPAACKMSFVWPALV